MPELLSNPIGQRELPCAAVSTGPRGCSAPAGRKRRIYGLDIEYLGRGFRCVKRASFELACGEVEISEGPLHFGAFLPISEAFPRGNWRTHVEREPTVWASGRLLRGAMSDFRGGVAFAPQPAVSGNSEPFCPGIGPVVGFPRNRGRRNAISPYEDGHVPGTRSRVPLCPASEPLRCAGAH